MTEEEQEKYSKEATAKILLETGSMSLRELMEWHSPYEEIEI